MPKTMGQCPTTRSWPGDPPLIPLNYCWRQHWVDCCIASSNGGPLRPRPRLSLYFLMGLALTPHTREQAMAPPYPIACALHGPMGSRGVMSWGHRCSTHREWAKPLEGGAAATHFGCVYLLFLLSTLYLFHIHTYLVVHRVVQHTNIPTLFWKYNQCSIFKEEIVHPYRGTKTFFQKTWFWECFWSFFSLRK